MSNKYTTEHELNEQKEIRSFFERWRERLTRMPKRRRSVKTINRDIRTAKRGRMGNNIRLAKLENSDKSEIRKYGDRKFTLECLERLEGRLGKYKAEKKEKRKPRKKSRETYYTR